MVVCGKVLGWGESGVRATGVIGGGPDEPRVGWCVPAVLRRVVRRVVRRVGVSAVV